METYATVLVETKKWNDAKAEAIHIILTRIDNDIYFIIDVCPNAMEMWKAIERLKQCESINVQDIETNLYLKIRKFASREDSISIHNFIKMSNTNNTMQTQTSNALHNAIMESCCKDRPPMLAPGSTETTTERYMENYKNVSQDIHNQLNAKVGAVQIILTWIDNDIYSIVDACPNACEMWKAIERLKQGESINSQELKTVSYHKLYDILKQHQNEVNEIRAERLPLPANPLALHEVNEIRVEKIARIANPLALVAQQQPNYHPQTHPTHYNQNSSTRSQQAATRNRGKAFVNSPQPIYDQEPSMVAEDKETTKDKEIDKLLALISLSFKKIYKPTNNNLRTSSNTRNMHVDNTSRFDRRTRYSGSAADWDSVLQLQKILACSKGMDDTNDEPEDQELEAHYMYMEKIQEVIPDAADKRADQDDQMLQQECELLASLTEQMKIEIDGSKQNNKSLESSNKDLREYLKKAQNANPRLYDIGCYNDNLALILAPESEEMIRLAQEGTVQLGNDQSAPILGYGDLVQGNVTI
nr:hypothetical protein [Tanacetum cinerariifolium]